jgi:hypothetical protein
MVIERRELNCVHQAKFSIAVFTPSLHTIKYFRPIGDSDTVSWNCKDCVDVLNHVSTFNMTSHAIKIASDASSTEATHTNVNAT